MERLVLKNHHSQTHLYCYRLDYRADYDEAVLWRLVQQHGGVISVHPDYLQIWIHPAWHDLLMLSLPDLVRNPELDRA